jgi:hypothetical protein
MRQSAGNKAVKRHSAARSAAQTKGDPLITAMACSARVRSPLLLKTTSPRPAGIGLQPVVPLQYSQRMKVTQRGCRGSALLEFASVVPCEAPREDALEAKLPE